MSSSSGLRQGSRRTEDRLKIAVAVLVTAVVGLTISLFFALRGPDRCIAQRAAPGSEPSRLNRFGIYPEDQLTEPVEGVVIDGRCVPRR